MQEQHPQNVERCQDNFAQKYFCSYAGAGSSAFPTLKTILYDLGVSDARYRKHFKPLVEFGYITVEKIRDEFGRWDRNVYELIVNVPAPSDGERGIHPHQQNLCVEEKRPHQQNPRLDNVGTNNNNEVVIDVSSVSNSVNNTIIKSPSVRQSVSPSVSS